MPLALYGVPSSWLRGLTGPEPPPLDPRPLLLAFTLPPSSSPRSEPRLLAAALEPRPPEDGSDRRASGVPPRSRAAIAAYAPLPAAACSGASSAASIVLQLGVVEGAGGGKGL